MTRISVLSKPEGKEFDEPPIFDSIDRKRYYDITVTLKNALNKLRTPANKVYFLVSYAYFKARKRFHDGKFREQDIEYAHRLLNIDTALASLLSYARKTRLEHQVAILIILGYRSFNNYSLEDITHHVYLQIKSYKSPRLIFADMIDYLLARKIALPRYRQFVNIISDQIQRYKLDIHECLAKCLDNQTKSKLDALMCQDDDKHYSLRFIKRYNQSLRPGNIRKNLDDFNRVKLLYALVEKPFKALDLNHEGAMYLTRFVARNRTLHLSQRTDDTRHVSLIAFIAYQYFQGHDTLADILLQFVQSVKDAVHEQLKNQRAQNTPSKAEPLTMR